MFVEGELCVVGGDDGVEGIVVDFLDAFYEFLADALALVFFSLNDNSTC